MDLISQIIQILIALFTSPAGIGAVTIISAIVAIAILLLGKYIPSSKFHFYGVYAGELISRKGNSFKFLNPGLYEEIEFTFIGSLKAFIDGFVEGLVGDNLK